MFLINDFHKSSALVLTATGSTQSVTVRPLRVVGEPPPRPSLEPEDLDDESNWAKAFAYEHFFMNARFEPSPLPHAGRTFEVCSNDAFLALLEMLASAGHVFPSDYIEHLKSLGATGKL